MTPVGYYSAAKDYLEAGKIISLSPHRPCLGPARFFLPIHMLLGFASELYLKAWLRHGDMPSKKLASKPYGHDLNALYAKACDLGLPSIPKIDELISHLAAEHTAFGYRYMKDNHSYTATNLPMAFAVLNLLDCEVDTRIGAGLSLGLQPGR
jgi:hypothetical protein